MKTKAASQATTVQFRFPGDPGGSTCPQLRCGPTASLPTLVLSSTLRSRAHTAGDAVTQEGLSVWPLPTLGPIYPFRARCLPVSPPASLSGVEVAHEHCKPRLHGAALTSSGQKGYLTCVSVLLSRCLVLREVLGQALPWFVSTTGIWGSRVHGGETRVIFWTQRQEKRDRSN